MTEEVHTLSRQLAETLVGRDAFQQILDFWVIIFLKILIVNFKENNFCIINFLTEFRHKS